jgi:hypothetical protein
MTFRATLLLGGKTATGIEVPEEVVAALGSARRVAVRATIGGYTYRSTVAPMGGKFMLPVSAEVRAQAGIAAGDEVDVTLELDDTPRSVTVPPDLASALVAAPQAAAFFEKLSFSHKQAYVLWIDSAKKPETRTTRVAKTIEMLVSHRRSR